MSDDRESPIEQLLELLVYAPVGLLYEYEEVLPKLIRRGKSQVQLARVLSEMAVQRSQGGAEDALGDLVSVGAGLLARLVTEAGAAVGLAPTATTGWPPAEQAHGPEEDSPDTVSAERVADAEQGADAERSDDGSLGSLSEASIDEAGGDTSPGGGLPIAGYHDLPARVIVPLLDDLTDGQRRTIRDHESANRARKTILAKLDRLQQN